MRRLLTTTAGLVLAFALHGCSRGSGTEGDTSTDTAGDTSVDTVLDVQPDPGADPDAPVDTAEDPAPDTSTDPGTDPPADTVVDTLVDTVTDPGTDSPCSDPCYVSGTYVSGCTAMCGGFAGTPCPDTTVLTCVYARGSDAGICIPTVNLGCTIDADCSCFPHFSICTTSRWTCSGGSCAVACIP